MIEDMRQDFKDSRAGKYRQDPKRICGLFEHEYALEISDEAWKATADHAEKCVRNFYHAPVFQKLRELPATAWLEIEERSTFQLDGLKVYVQLDCAFRDRTTGVVSSTTGRPARPTRSATTSSSRATSCTRWKNGK